MGGLYLHAMDLAVKNLNRDGSLCKINFEVPDCRVGLDERLDVPNPVPNQSARRTHKYPNQGASVQRHQPLDIASNRAVICNRCEDRLIPVTLS